MKKYLRTSKSHYEGFKQQDFEETHDYLNQLVLLKANKQKNPTHRMHVWTYVSLSFPTNIFLLVELFLIGNVDTEMLSLGFQAHVSLRLME